MSNQEGLWDANPTLRALAADAREEILGMYFRFRPVCLRAGVKEVQEMQAAGISPEEVKEAVEGLTPGYKGENVDPEGRRLGSCQNCTLGVLAVMEADEQWTFTEKGSLQPMDLDNDPPLCPGEKAAQNNESYSV